MIRYQMSRVDGGQGLVEYALILIFVALVVVATVIVFGTTLNTYYQGFAAAI
jgi:Flp pilus assembly pilin Flp